MPVLSDHFASRQPSSIRIAQIRFDERTDDTKAVNSAVDELKVVQGAELLFCARGFGLLGHQDT